MIKIIRNRIGLHIREWIKTNHPEYKKVKVDLRGSSWQGCDVYSRTPDALHQAWIIIGGTSDSTSLTTVIYWTRDGVELRTAPGWNWRSDPEIPSTGGLQLTERVLVGDDLVNGSRLITIEEPPQELREESIRLSKDVPLYKKVRELTVTEMRRKNPAVDDREITALLEKADKIKFGTWEGIERVMNIPEGYLEAAAQSASKKVVYLLQKYGIPFLERQTRSS